MYIWNDLQVLHTHTYIYPYTCILSVQTLYIAYVYVHIHIYVYLHIFLPVLQLKIYAVLYKNTAPHTYIYIDTYEYMKATLHGGLLAVDCVAAHLKLGDKYFSYLHDIFINILIYIFVCPFICRTSALSCSYCQYDWSRLSHTCQLSRLDLSVERSALTTSLYSVKLIVNIHVGYCCCWRCMG